MDIRFQAGGAIESAALAALQLSADYWDYAYEDLISQESSPQAIVDQDCADDGIPNDPRITRNGAGQLRVVRDQIVNVGRVDTNGVDMALRYVFDVGTLGTMGFDARATYINKFEIVRATGAVAEYKLGSRNATNGFAPTPGFPGARTPTASMPSCVTSTATATTRTPARSSACP